MSIQKLKFRVYEFADYMSGMRGFIKRMQADSDDESERLARITQERYDKIVKYAYIDEYDIEDDNHDAYVRCMFTDGELDSFYTLWPFAKYDDEPVDWFEYFKEKHEDYVRQKKEKEQLVINKYEQYMDDAALVNERGKKTKKHFAQTNGFSYDFVCVTLRE